MDFRVNATMWLCFIGQIWLACHNRKISNVRSCEHLLAFASILLAFC
jgi:hypothetical protein